MPERVERIDARAGYDRWAKIYDQRPTALVALDRRWTLQQLQPARDERILDAGCGTGAHLESICAAGARAVGLDLSVGMLAAARVRRTALGLVQADLDRPLPLAAEVFDAVLCSLVSEHLADLRTFFASAFTALRPGGRLVFSAFHPAMAAAGVEANFELDGTEYRLGAELHTLEDYLAGISEAGFEAPRCREYRVDAELVEEAPSAAKHLGQKLLLLIQARRPA
jgi:SAM-dependent methyltransferase